MKQLSLQTSWIFFYTMYKKMQAKSHTLMFKKLCSNFKYFTWKVDLHIFSLVITREKRPQINFSCLSIKHMTKVQFSVKIQHTSKFELSEPSSNMFEFEPITRLGTVCVWCVCALISNIWCVQSIISFLGLLV